MIIQLIPQAPLVVNFELRLDNYVMVSETHKKIGQRIKDLRIKKGLSREELAFRIGVSGSYVGMIERAEYDFKISKLINIAIALDLKMKDIVSVD